MFWYEMNWSAGLSLMHLESAQLQASWATDDNVSSILQLSWYSCLKTRFSEPGNNYEVHTGDYEDPGYRNPYPNVLRNGWNVGELGHHGSLIQQETFTVGCFLELVTRYPLKF
jgi:hypothetical protein